MTGTTTLAPEVTHKKFSGLPPTTCIALAGLGRRFIGPVHKKSSRISAGFGRSGLTDWLIGSPTAPTKGQR